MSGPVVPRSQNVGLPIALVCWLFLLRKAGAGAPSCWSQVSGGTMSLDAVGDYRLNGRARGVRPFSVKLTKSVGRLPPRLGQLIENPIWKVSPWKTLLTAHPLRGCPIAENGTEGAVDDFGRLFRGPGVEVHPNPYVAHGSIMRTTLGVNPFLISALAERVADQIISTM